MYTEYYIMKSLSSDNQSLFAFTYSFQNLSKCCLKEKSLLFERFKKFSDTWELKQRIDKLINKSLCVLSGWCLQIDYFFSVSSAFAFPQ